MTFSSREEAEAVVGIATDGQRADVPGRWLDRVQASAYPDVCLASLAERLEHAHALVKDAGHCRCGDGSPGFLFALR